MAQILFQRQSTNRAGSAMVWVVMMITVMMGFCALAVDLTRAEVAKTELQRIADSAAEAAASQIAGGTTAITAAVNGEINKYNEVDGSPLSQTNDVVIQTGFWNATNKTFTVNGTPLNAVKVIVSRSSSNKTKDPIPMMFAQALGKSSLSVWAQATAATIQVKSIDVSVSAHSNPWLAGTENQAPGTIHASVPMDKATDYNPNTLANNTKDPSHPWEFDINGPTGQHSSTGESYESPQLAEDSSGNQLDLQAGDILTFSSVTGMASNDSSASSGNTTANGENNGSIANYSDVGASPGTTTYPAPSYTGSGNPSSPTDASGSENYISNINAPINSMIGVFLNGSSNQGSGAVPQQLTGSNMPPGLDFSSQTARDYTTIDPQVQQSFYVGTGLTSTNQTQSIVVPANAGRLYMGTMDGQEWSNNAGTFKATISQSRVQLVQ
jgi:hypothetical protein